MKIEYFKLEKRSDILSSKFPQRDFAGLVRGLGVRFDIVKINDIPSTSFASSGVVYDNAYISIPSEVGAINVHQSGKYGVSLDRDGFVSLGVKVED